MDPWFLAAGLIVIYLEVGALSYAFFGENPLFRSVEMVDIAATCAYTSLVSVSYLQRTWASIMSGAKSPILILAYPIGVLSLTTLYRPLSWVSRYPIMFMVGASSGLALAGAMESDFMGQIRGVMEKPLLNFDNIVYVFATLTCITVFLFSINIKRENRTLNTVMRIGRVMLMFYIGANFANTVQFRIAKLMNRMQAIFWDFFGMRPY
jgi:hypothetical protein